MSLIQTRNSNGDIATRRNVASGHGAGLRFYCGRKGGYSCYSCDGVCGPTNGCNCLSCRELDATFAYATNSKGDAAVRKTDIWHGNGPRFYCGKKADYVCRSCDGVCGPTNGCNCSSCQELDNVFLQARNSKGDLATRMIVTTGHIKGIRFYCGKKGDYRCLQCDGFCGPTNGCNCSACKELDTIFAQIKISNRELAIRNVPIPNQNRKVEEIESSYEIEYNDNTFKLRTNAQTLSEVEKAIKSKLKLQENIEFVLHYKENGKLIVFDDIKDLKDGMTIKVSIPSQPNSDNEMEFFQLKVFNDAISLSQGGNSEFRVEIDPDEIPNQNETQIIELMDKFSKLQTCVRSQSTSRSNVVFQVDFQTKNRAEKVFEQLVELFESSS